MSDNGVLDFADGKEAQAFRTIGEVAVRFGLRQHVLRYWEDNFPMLRPLKRAGGRRYYRPEDVALIAEISRLLYQEGFTIRGARQAIEARARGAVPAAMPEGMPEVVIGTRGTAPAEEEAPATPIPSTGGGDLTARLKALRATLASALAD